MNNIIEKELLKNAQVFLQSNDLYKAGAFQYFKDNGLPETITKDIAPRFYQKSLEQLPINTEDVLDARGVLHFTNGIFDSAHSTIPNGLELQASKLEEKFINSLDALNALASIETISFVLKKNIAIDFPISIIYSVTESAVNKIISPRIQFTLEENSQASFMEFYSSHTNVPYTTNALTTFIVKENAQVEHVKLSQEAKSSVHLGWTTATLLKNARFYTTNIDLGNLNSNQQLHIKLCGSGAETSANSLFLLEGVEKNTTFTTIHHRHSHTHSTQLSKGILKDESFGTFDGNIIVDPDAQEITSKQLNKNLLLSKKAHIKTKPQLLVNANDVKCAHGATVGQLSAEEIFYLESRGIKKEKARDILMQGFASEIFFLIKNNKIRSFCEKKLTLK